MDIARALEEAEKAARSVIESRLGARLGDYRVVVRASETREGGIDFSVEVSVTASKLVPREVVNAIVEEAIIRARKAFEEVVTGVARGSELSKSRHTPTKGGRGGSP
ncbi:MAG: hypothetical protein LRS46_00905 [Desulfurococcales archaeon]|nr:hypothetical protein [Desulfurococcales archaeon]